MNESRPTALSCAAFLHRSEDFLESAGRLLGLELELLGQDLACMSSSSALETHAAGAPAARNADLALSRQHAGAVLRQGRPRSWQDSRGTSWCAYPVPGPDRPVGVLVARDPEGRPCGAEQDEERTLFLERTVRVLADELFLLRRNEDLSEELSERYDQLQVLYSAAGRLASPVGQIDSFRTLLRKMLTPLSADAALLVIPGRKLFEVAVRTGLSDIDPEARRTWSRVMRKLEEHVLVGRRPFYMGSPWEIQDAPPPLDRKIQALALRVLREGRPGGYLALLRFDPTQPFRSGDIKLVESLSEQVALAVANTELYEDLEGFLMATVKSLVNAIEAKDPYTSGHSERVNLISMLLGRQMGLAEGEMENLRWASILHDVGKIGMPESILLKPARLTRDEYEIIKEHPERGFRLLQPIRQLADAARIVRAHHERVDGKGYPDGIGGEEIPLAARIIAVADTFDALTTTRSYRKAAAVDFAVEEIRRVRGTQLDEEVVERFLELAPFLREHRIMFHATSEIDLEEAA